MIFQVVMNLNEAELSLLGYMSSTLPDSEFQNLNKKIKQSVREAMLPENDGQFDLTFDQAFGD